MAEARQQAPDLLPQREECGLALSGGGIRSATFCLGLLSAMAGVTDPQHTERRLLQRFKYLSTVSGGGFTGAMFGRLFRPVADNPGYGWAEINALLSGENRRLLWWLRKSGRYLTPKGIGDGVVALFALLRGFVATQFEVGILFLWFGSLLLAPHLLLRQQLACLPAGAQYLNIGAHLGSVWWWLLPLPLFGGLTAMWAYWFSRDRRNGGWGDWLGTVLFGLLPGAWFWREGLLQWPRELAASAGATVGFLLPFSIGAALLASVAGLLLSRLNPAPPRQARSAYTRLLALHGALGLGLVALALLDFGSWRLMSLLQGDIGAAYAAGGIGLTGALALLARVLAPLLQQMLESGGKHALRVEWLANALGLLLLLALLLTWATAAQYLVFGNAGHGLLAADGDPWPPGWRWSALFTVPALYALLSRAHIEQLNLSSLHHFYRSRLAAAYVSVGNHDFWGTLHGAERGKLHARVNAAFESDDTALRDYRPDADGGPVHLINVCINQTIDDRTGLYSADRKGVALSVSSEGLEYGNWAAQPGAAADDRGLTLAQWVAISGAAASSGMGSSTRPGLAALMFLSGLRLGYWLENPAPQQPANWSRLFRYLGPKYAALLSELFGQFPGVRNPYWYLSDGGHFDNTGVYALLKRKLRLIVLADCGADPLFLFGDLENLMRKARVDLDAAIEFIDPASIPNICRGMFGTPNSITPDPGMQHLLLARIRYGDGASGLLLVVKPRRLTALPFDVVGYADRHPTFPQQTTGDQFFDEAQWESYFALGKTLGASVTPDLLALLHAAEPTLTTVSLPSVACSLASPAAQLAGQAVSEPDWLQRRQRVLGTVGATVGIGALIPLLLTGWQAWQSASADEQSVRFFYDSYRDLVSRIEQLGPQPTPVQTIELRARLHQLTMLASELGSPLAKQSVTNLLAQVRDTRRAMSPTQPAATTPPAQPDPLGMESLAELGKLLDGARGGDNANLRYWFGSGQPLSCAPPAAVSPPAPDMAQLQLQLPSLVLPGLSAGTASAATEQPCAASGGRPLRLFIQIYDEASRPAAQRMAARAIGNGLLVPEIENVSVTATRKRQAVPFIWDRQTWILHAPAEQPCAHRLAGAQDRWLNLPPALQASPGVIELWIPPARNGAGQ